MSVEYITYEIFSLRVPFRGTLIHQFYLNIMKGKYEEILIKYSNDLRNIIRTFLCLGPMKLPSAEELLIINLMISKLYQIFYNINQTYYKIHINFKQKINLLFNKFRK